MGLASFMQYMLLNLSSCTLEHLVLVIFSAKIVNIYLLHFFYFRLSYGGSKIQWEGLYSGLAGNLAGIDLLAFSYGPHIIFT